MSIFVEFDDGVTLSISKQALTEISRLLAQKGFALETGGILLGRQKLKTLSFEITFASMPTARDVGNRFSFIRNKDSANRIINAAWTQASGTVNYLGEWHTHNQKIPSPSLADYRLMQQVVADGSCLLDRSFMLIVGNSNCAYTGAVNPEKGNTGIYSERHITWEI